MNDNINTPNIPDAVKGSQTEGKEIPVQDTFEPDAATQDLIKALAPEPPDRPDMDFSITGSFQNPIYDLYSRWMQHQHEYATLLDATAFGRYMYSEIPKDDVIVSNFSHLFEVGLENYARRMISTFETSTIEMESFDAEIFLRVDTAQMFVLLCAFPPHRNGAEMSVDQIHDILKTNGIVFGIDEQAIEDAVIQKSYFRFIKIASGVPVKHGKHGKALEFFLRKPIIDLKPDEHGRVDYKNLNLYQTITKDEVICEYLPPEPGQDGTSVYGKVIKAREGKPAMTMMGENTYVTEDRRQLKASIPGRIYFYNSSFNIQSCLEIHGNIDNSTGNLSFPGDVIIYGDVMSGFEIKAHGNITVHGMVEAATIYSDSDIILTSGINGDDHGLLVAKGNIISKFIQNCTVRAEESVHSDSLIWSQVYCNGSVCVDTGKGAVIGGSIVARNEVNAITLGNQRSQKLSIRLGLTADMVTKKNMLTDQNNKLKSTLESMEKNVAFLNSLPKLNKTQEAVLQALLSQIPLYQENIGHNEEDYAKLHNEMTDFSHCAVKFKTCNPPLTIQIGATTNVINEVYDYGKFMLTDGEIHYYSDY